MPKRMLKGWNYSVSSQSLKCFFGCPLFRFLLIPAPGRGVSPPTNLGPHLKFFVVIRSYFVDYFVGWCHTVDR